MELCEGHPLSAIFVDLNSMTITLVNGNTLPITNLFDVDRAHSRQRRDYQLRTVTMTNRNAGKGRKC